MNDKNEISRTLMLLRHGKSDWNAGTSGDFSRPLAPRGIRAARRMGLFLVEQSLIPDLIISSPAARAIGTAQIVQNEISNCRIQQAASIYGAGPADLWSVVEDIPAHCTRVLLIGHNPGFEYFAEELAGESTVVMKTCSLAVLHGVGPGWPESRHSGFTLAGLYHPKELQG